MSNRDYLTLIGIDLTDAIIEKPDAVDLPYGGFPSRALRVLKGYSTFMLALQGYAASLQDDGLSEYDITSALKRQIMYHNERYKA